MNNLQKLSNLNNIVNINNNVMYFNGVNFMKLKNKIFIISLMLLVILGISAASASGEDVTLTNDTMEVLTSNDDVEVQMQDSNDKQLSNSEEDKLSRIGSFADLRAEIENSYGSTLVLDDSYENNENEAAITLEENII